MSKFKRTDVYKLVNDSILQALEQGQAIWHKPFKDGKRNFPLRGSTLTSYNGFNVFWLNWIRQVMGYESNVWMTFNQAKKLGGNVIKGQKANNKLKSGSTLRQFVIYWNWLERPAKDEDGQPMTDEDGKTVIETIPILKHHTVFNLDQIENIDKAKYETADDESDFNNIIACDEFVKLYDDRPSIRHTEQGRAYYSPSEDYVHMPKPELFDTSEHYYTTLFHELAHSTGHKDRLNRKSINTLSSFGDHNYSYEELVAETSAAYISHMTGINNDDIVKNSHAYLKGWHKQLKDPKNKKWIVNAFSQAEKAVKYMAGVKEFNELTAS